MQWSLEIKKYQSFGIPCGPRASPDDTLQTTTQYFEFRSRKLMQDSALFDELELQEARISAPPPQKSGSREQHYVSKTWPGCGPKSVVAYGIYLLSIFLGNADSRDAFQMRASSINTTSPKWAGMRGAGSSGPASIDHHRRGLHGAGRLARFCRDTNVRKQCNDSDEHHDVLRDSRFHQLHDWLLNKFPMSSGS